MLVFWILALGFVVAAAVTTAWAGWRAAPFVPTRMADVRRMLDLAELRDGDRVYDLGAGDGRLLILAAERRPSIRAVGFELSVFFFILGWLRVKLSPARRRIQFRLRDFFHQSLAEADVVVCFLTPAAMRKLEPKFQRELRPGTRVISAVFSLPNWRPETVDKPPGRVSVYRYVVASGSR